MKNPHKFLLFLTLLFLHFKVFAQPPEVYIGISAGQTVKMISLGIAKFLPSRKDNLQDIAIANYVQEIIRNDLMYSRYFRIVENVRDSDKIEIDKDTMNSWKVHGVNYLIIGKAGDFEKTWTFSAKVYDLESRKPVLEKFYQGEKGALRQAAHLFSDDVVMRLTGRVGIAHSKIAFVNNSTGNKEIYVVDYDGENLVKVTNDRAIALLPRWSNDGSRIYYTTYRYGNPDMFEINLKEGKIKPFTTYQGLNIPGGFSPDGMTMVMTLSRGDDPNIWTISATTKEIKKLLTRFGVCASPTYSPDGKQVAFVSDRSGNPQIYVLELETQKIRRLTRLNWCDSPAWSPSGEWIAFAGRETPKEQMNIFLIDLTGNQIRRLTSNAGSNEDPSWSPDGRFIAFTSTRRGKRELFVMDYDGSAPHALVNIKGDCFTPNWSP